MRRIQKFMERDDVITVGPITPSIEEELGELFTMSAQVDDNRILNWFCYSVSTERIIISSGLLGSGLQGDIHADIRPLYMRYQIQDNISRGYYFLCYSDILGTIFIGYLYLIRLDDSDEFRVITLNTSPDTFTILPITPSSYPQLSLDSGEYPLLSGVKYRFGDIDIAVTAIASYAGDNRLNGITRGFNIPLASPHISSVSDIDYIERMYNSNLMGVRRVEIESSGIEVVLIHSDMNIQLHPVSLYDPAYFCNRITESIGYVPQTMVSAQCLLVPDTNFGRSSYCRNPYMGLTTRSECEEIGIRYHYAWEYCGESYTWTNFIGENITVDSSMGGQCDQCVLVNGQFDCVEGEVDTEPTMDRLAITYEMNISPTESGIESLNDIEVRILGIVAITISLVIIFILIVLILMVYMVVKNDKNY